MSTEEVVGGHLRKHSLSLRFGSGHAPPQGQGSCSASLSESPGELARNADWEQELSLPTRDSGKGMKWGLDIHFP